LSLNTSAQNQFTATVSGTGSYSSAVTWSAQRGRITSAGLYTAPSTGSSDVVTATSVQDTTKTATATITLTIPSSSPPSSSISTAAFPGAQGFGAGASGGRGGVVYTVNTLADTTNSPSPGNGAHGATCSFRDAMTASGPRTIVFSVGGTIVLHDQIYPVPDNVTIAGQTAPGGGIQIVGDGTFGDGGCCFYLGSNSIVRFLRIRPGVTPINSFAQGLSGISFSMPAGNDNCILDHISFTWDGNKAVSWWCDAGMSRQTISWCLDAESLSSHCTGLLAGQSNMSNLDSSSWDGHHNVLATIDHRLPYTACKYGAWINNYVFGYSYAALVRGGTQFDFIGNVWDGMTSNIKSNGEAEVRWADTSADNESQPVPSGTAQIYMANNFGPDNPTGSLDNFSTMLRTASTENSQLNNNVISSTYKATSSAVPSGMKLHPISITTLSTPADLRNLLLPTVGCYASLTESGAMVPNRDSLDAHIVGYINNPSTSPSSFIASPGTLPTLATGTYPTCSMNDGIPDSWKTAHGLSTTDASVYNTIRPNANGYTNLELYLSGLYPNGTPLP